MISSGASDELKHLSPEARIKRLRELQEKRRMELEKQRRRTEKDIEKTKKLIKETKEEIDEELHEVEDNHLPEREKTREGNLEERIIEEKVSEEAAAAEEYKTGTEEYRLQPGLEYEIGGGPKGRGLRNPLRDLNPDLQQLYRNDEQRREENDMYHERQETNMKDSYHGTSQDRGQSDGLSSNILSNMYKRPGD